MTGNRQPSLIPANHAPAQDPHIAKPSFGEQAGRICGAFIGMTDQDDRFIGERLQIAQSHRQISNRHVVRIANVAERASELFRPTYINDGYIVRLSET